MSRAEFWTGLRPMTPDGTPIIGADAAANLYLATGHGTLGWTMAAGTGRVMADLMSGRTPEIDLSGPHPRTVSAVSLIAAALPNAAASGPATKASAAGRTSIRNEQTAEIGSPSAASGIGVSLVTCIDR